MLLLFVLCRRGRMIGTDDDDDDVDNDDNVVVIDGVDVTKPKQPGAVDDDSCHIIITRHQPKAAVEEDVQSGEAARRCRIF
jgi:hypothetical protein